MSVAVELDHLSVHHGEVRALDDVSLTVAAGELVALLGPNGAGKTTTVDAIHGAVTPASGAVRVFGADPGGPDRPASRWSIMPQRPSLPMGLTAGECVRLFAALHDRPASHADEMIAATGLGGIADRRWRGLSGGELQRVSLAVALCGGTDLIVLDEPTAAVDAEGRDRILDIVERARDDGAAVLVTTHRFDDVERLADRVVVLDRGRVVADETLAGLTEDRPVIRFRTNRPLESDHLAELEGRYGTVHLTPGNVHEIEVAPTPATVAEFATWFAAHGIDVPSIEAGFTPLEQRYREILARAADADVDTPGRRRR